MLAKLDCYIVVRRAESRCQIEGISDYCSEVALWSVNLNPTRHISEEVM